MHKNDFSEDQNVAELELGVGIEISAGWLVGMVLTD